MPAAFLTLLYVLPAVAWLALVGLVVPVLVIERPGVATRFAVRSSSAVPTTSTRSPRSRRSSILFALVKLTLALCS